MFCRNCGKENEDGARFCFDCGAQLAPVEVTSTSFSDDSANVAETGPWRVFAKIGRVFGIISISTFWLFGVFGWAFGVPGIILSALGKKSNANYDIARSGLKLAIWGTVLGFLIYLAIIAVYYVIYGVLIFGNVNTEV